MTEKELLQNWGNKENDGVKEKNIFKKVYKNTAICLCRRCAKELIKDIDDWSDTK